ncbi:hypothetical protein PI87_02570 [Ralstonia sp. A12]|uniref:hypothetical protein n=1 Tax=Ralstonia sp. A12 TaxID=1217052 RepID=UPI000574BF9D|nr:hypothetical protein [Ralstonia sp. A12]KHK58651.1 hypothetical protein PI87_02570 [Ralstonia sp. A12]
MDAKQHSSACAARAPAKLKALYANQQAAALLHGGDFVAARREFHAIAATSDLPMRAWAMLGSCADRQANW